MRILSYKNKKLDFFPLNKKTSLFLMSKLVRKSFTQKTLPRLKKENFLHLNFKIDSYFYDKKNVIKSKTSYIIKDLFSTSSLIYSLRKNMILKSLGYQKQYFYFLIDIILALSIVEKEIVSLELFSIFKTYNCELHNKTKDLNQVIFNSISNTNSNAKVQKNIYSALTWTKLHTSFNLINFKLSFLYLSLFLNKNVNLSFNFSFNSEVFTIEKYLSLQFVSQLNHSKLSLRHLIRRKHLLNFLLGQQTNATIKNQNLNYLIANRILKQDNNSNLISKYKQGSFGFQNILRFGIKNQIQKKKFRNLNNQFKFKQEIPASLLYLFTRLEEKKEILTENIEKQEQIIGLRNFFIQKAKQKFNNITRHGYSLTTLSYLNTLYYDDEEKDLIYSEAVEEELNSNKITENNIIDVENYKIFGLKKLNIINKEELDHEKEELDLNKKILWKQKKLVDLKSTATIKNIDKYFSVFLGENVSVIFINALALTKFAYVFPMKKKSAQRFLNHIEREMIQRYKYVAVYIQDFIRVCYISFFLKKPTFLANFMGYQIAQLPRNRKETQFIRFLIKVIKIFVEQRSEIIAVKVEFKGRVNRWRRTKVIRGTRGTISFFKFNTRIEFGSGKAITRKGALGIRLWICYKWTFTPILRTTLLGYMEYSQQFKAKTIDKFLYRFQSKINQTSTNKISW